MGTYGRYSMSSEALSCFLDQDYEDKELIILNQHKVPLVFDHPQVKIYNIDDKEVPNLQTIRRKCLEYATGDYVIFWDDDDLMMPYHLSTAAKYIKNNIIWKPFEVFMSNYNTDYHVVSSNMEATHLIKKDFALSIPTNSHNCDDHSLFAEISDKLKVEVLPHSEISYVYRWANNSYHLSGAYGSKTMEERILLSRETCVDTGDMKPMVHYNMYEKRWKQMLEKIPNKFNVDEFEKFKFKIESYF
jgi:glycosyltransferase involved in cell wall biosynthesis